MSESDSFIREVSEEVRQDQMFKLWKKWGPFVIAGVVLIVGAAAAWSWMQSQEQAAAEARGSALLAADPTVPAETSALVDTMEGPSRLLAEFGAAAALAEAGEADAAGARYVELAGRAGLAPEYADLARLQAVRLGAGDPAMLDGLADGSGPYQLLALELRAARRVEAGDAAAAHADLNTILNDEGATNGLRQRALVLLLASGGTFESEETDANSGS